MEYIKGMYSGLRDWYGTLNPATLSGAIDVVVVEQEDGTLACSPFHVRFGKMGVLRSTEKLVDIEINGEPVENLFMKLGENGEAFFVEETTEGEEPLAPNLATSPIPSDISLMEEGIRRLHAREIGHSDEDDDSRSEQHHLRATERLLNYVKEPSTEEETGGGAEMAMETQGGGSNSKGRRQLKLENPLLNEEDTDSSLEDSKEGGQERGTDGDAKGSKLPRVSSGQKSRTKLRKKRKRGGIKGSISNTEISKTAPSRRKASLSDSNEPVSSSDELGAHGVVFTLEDVEGLSPPRDPPRVPPVIIPQVNRQAKVLTGLPEITQEDWSAMSLEPKDRVFHVFSEGDMTPLISPEGTRPPTPKSDTELQMNRPYHSALKPGSISDNEKIEWNWGELPEASPARKDDPASVVSSLIDGQTKAEQEKQRKISLWDRWPLSRRVQQSDDPQQRGMYLEDLASDALDPEVYALYFPEAERRLRTIAQHCKDEDKSSDLGASLPQSPSTIESGCESPPSLEDLRFHDLQMSLCGGLKVEDGEVPLDKFNEHVITFDKFCSDPLILNNPNLVMRMGGKFYTWQMAAPILMSLLAFHRPLPEQTVSSLLKRPEEAGRRGITAWFWPRNYAKPESPRKGEDATQEAALEDVVVEVQAGKPDETKDIEVGEEEDVQQTTTERYKKSIRLSSDELRKLNLRHGPNHVCFSVTTRYQGTTQCQATIYLWRHNSKVIVSDIDGTITKSDVFGQILPVIGKDWTHSGVAKLFDGIQKNGYEFVFLSARAIGQSKVTKDYLKGVVQDSLSLPDGPLLLNPSSLLRALHREVIIKKPEEFKIRCLKDIQSLFPQDDKSGGPFYAGFGNRINDTWAYRAVGIPSARVFTINPQGKVTHEFTKSFQTSYPLLRNLTDQLFPPIDRVDRVTLVEAGQFSTFTYWRQPLPDIDPDFLEC